MEQGKEYYAFISYKREDEKWAKWLQNKLEHYKFPTNLNGRTDLPKNIRPTFRDVTDLKPGVLAEEINNALRNSEWLIVVCSPRSAKSPWVCKEAQTFIDLGRADHIIPLVIEGNPFSNDTSTECYPEALLNLTGSKELLAANINEMGRDAAAIKVVARMFNLRFDALWQRYEREKKRKTRLLFVILVAILAITFCVTAWIWNQNKLLKEKDWSLMEQKARLMAKRIDQMIENEENDALGLLLLDILPSDIENPNRPLVPEAEATLRKYWDIPRDVTYRHTSRVNYACYSPDGKTIVTASDDATLKVWDVCSGTLLLESSKTEGLMQFVSFSHDGSKIVSVSKNRVTIWDAKTCEKIEDIEYDSQTAFFSPDDSQILLTNGKEINVRNANTAEPVMTIPQDDDNGYFRSASYSHDGQRILATFRRFDLDNHNTCDIKVYDSQTGNLVLQIDGHDGYSDDYVNCTCFSHNGKYIASGAGAPYDYPDIDLNRNVVKLWDATDGHLIRTMKGHTELVTNIAFSPDNTLIASSSGDGTIKIWETETGILKKTIECHKKYEYRWTNLVASSMFSPDGMSIVSAAYDSTAIISKLGNHTMQDEFTDNDGILYGRYSPMDEMFMTAHKDKVKLWNIKTRKMEQVIDVGVKPVSAVFSSDGSKMAMGVNGEIKIWDIKQRKWCGHFPAEYEDFIRFDPSGTKVLTTTREYDTDMAQIWDLNSGKLIRKWEAQEFCTKFLEWNHSGSRVATGYMMDVIIHDAIVEDKYMHQYISFGETMRRSVSTAQFSPDDTYLNIACTDGSILVWNLKRDSIIYQITNAHSDEISQIEYSLNGKYYLTTAGDGFVKVWDASSHCMVYEKAFLDEKILMASFNANSDSIMVCLSNKIVFMDFPPIHDLIKKLRERYKNRHLTSEERRKYYLE